MIDGKGCVKCENCGKEHVLALTGTDYVMKWYCPKCHHFQREISDPLDNKEKPVLSSRVG